MRRNNSYYITLSLSLPGNDYNTIDLDSCPKVNHEDWLVRIVVIHDGTVGQVGVLLAIHCKGAVAILPLFPCVSLVIDPCGPLESLVGN